MFSSRKQEQRARNFQVVWVRAYETVVLLLGFSGEISSEKKGLKIGNRWADILGQAHVSL